MLIDLDLGLVTRGSSGSESGLCALYISATLGSAYGTSVIDTKDSFRCKRAPTMGCAVLKIEVVFNRARLDRIADHSQRRYLLIVNVFHLWRHCPFGGR
jgi:hypothetical protein